MKRKRNVCKLKCESFSTQPITLFLLILICSFLLLLFLNSSGSTSIRRCWVLSHFYHFLNVCLLKKEAYFLTHKMASSQSIFKATNFIRQMLVTASTQNNLWHVGKAMPQRLQIQQSREFIYRIHLMIFIHLHGGPDLSRAASMIPWFNHMPFSINLMKQPLSICTGTYMRPCPRTILLVHDDRRFGCSSDL